MIDKDKKIGYIRITGFNEHTADELRKILEQFKDDGGKGLILDLRDDPGGLLSAAVEVSDMFLDKGEIVSTKGRNTQPRHYEAQKDSPFEASDIPMVVMVNQNSASASEIVAAALQDHKRAVVVGQRSYGKGSVQNLIDLDGGSSILKLTVASYYRPSGENIHRFKNAKTTDKWGVSPDAGMEVKLNHRDFINWFIARRERDRAALAKGHRKTSEPDKADSKPGDKEAGRETGRQASNRNLWTTSPRQKPPSQDEPATAVFRSVRRQAARPGARNHPQPVGRAETQGRLKRNPGSANHFSETSAIGPEHVILLAIETTCDETAAAVLEAPDPPAVGVPRILSSVVASQVGLHARYGGVVPEIASRAHVRQILPMIDEALRRAGVTTGDLGAVAVATRPGLVGALVVGLTAAKALALSLGIPLVAVDHLEGHLYACQLAHPDREVYPCVGLVVSGGHTSLYRCSGPDRVRVSRRHDR